MNDPADPAGPLALAEVLSAGREARVSAIRRRTPIARLRRPREPHHQPPVLDPIRAEEEAMDRLYGERTGTVSACTARPPVTARGARKGA
jgi:hypothetical protein